MNFTFNPYNHAPITGLSAQLNQGSAVTPPQSQQSSSNKRIRILPDSIHLDNYADDESIMKVEPKHLHETPTSSSKSIKEVNEQIKHEVQRLKKQCSDLKIKTNPDDPNVHWFRDQLVFERVKVRRALVEKDQLKAEFEGLKITEQKIIIESDDFKIRWLQDQMNAERDKVIRVSVEEDQLKILLRRLEKKCSEQKFKMESDASKVHLLEDQLVSERTKVKRELGEKNQLKAELEGLEKQFSEQSIKMESDAFKVRQLEGQLHSETEEKYQLKDKLEAQKKQCSEQNIKIESDAFKVRGLEDQLHSEIMEKDQTKCSEQTMGMESDAFNLRQLEVHLNAEKAKVVTVSVSEENVQVQTEFLGLKEQCSLLVCRLADQRNMERVKKNEDLDESRAHALSLSDLVASLCNEKDKLSCLLELSANEVAAKREVIREIQSSMKGLEKKVTIVKQIGNVNVTQARKDGYSDGLREGRRTGWRESVDCYKREDCAATQAGSSSQAL